MPFATGFADLSDHASADVGWGLRVVSGQGERIAEGTEGRSLQSMDVFSVATRHAKGLAAFVDGLEHINTCTSSLFWVLGASDRHLALSSCVHHPTREGSFRKGLLSLRQEATGINRDVVVDAIRSLHSL